MLCVGVVAGTDGPERRLRSGPDRRLSVLLLLDWITRGQIVLFVVVFGCEKPSLCWRRARPLLRGSQSLAGPVSYHDSGSFLFSIMYVPGSAFRASARQSARFENCNHDPASLLHIPENLS